MGYPTAQPAWEQQQLNELSAAGLLSGINPLVLSGIAGNESGYENAGAGINSEGYGGFFGLGEDSTYHYGSSSYTETPAILSSDTPQAFDQQAQAAAAEVASLLNSNNGSLQGALAQYTGGGPTNGDYELAMTDLAGASPLAPQAGSGELVITGTGSPGAVGTPTSAAGVGTGINASPTSYPGGALDPLNLPGEVGSAAAGSLQSLFSGYVMRGILVIIALILLKVGFDKLLDTNSTPAAIIEQSPQSVGGSESASDKGMSGPGTGHKDIEQRSTDAGPIQHDAERTVEAGAGAAAAA